MGIDEGLADASVIACDNIVSLPKPMLAETAVGHLGLEKRAALDHALRYALDIQY